MTQKTDFPRIVKRLRLEKGISQKSAAASLNISQALLSHYEKGIRECGLGFIIKCAGFYNVSADYLLGITDSQNIAEVAESAGGANESVLKKAGIAYDSENILYKNSAAKSVACVFDTLKDSEDGVAEAAYKYFACCICLLCADISRKDIVFEKIHHYYNKFKENKRSITEPEGNFSDILKNLLHNAENY